MAGRVETFPRWRPARALAPERPAGAVNDEGLRWLTSAAHNPEPVRAEWATYPSSMVHLPVGRKFDVVDVPEEIGLATIELSGRIGMPTGPVAIEEGRALFLIQPGSIGAGPQTPLRDARGDAIDVRFRRRGDHIVAPPLTARDEGNRWIQPPIGNPPALPDLHDVLTLIVAAVNLRNGGDTSARGDAGEPR